MTLRLPQVPATAARVGVPRRALALLVATLAALAVVTGAAAPRAHAVEPPLPVSVSLVSVTPVALDPSTQMTVTALIRNTGRTTLTDLVVNLRLTWQALADRQALAAWAKLPPLDPSNGTKAESRPLPGPLAPGQSTMFSITMRGDSLQLEGHPLEVHGMAVEVQQGTDGTHRLGILRTFAVWNPGTTTPPARLALLLPVTAGRTPLDPTGTGAYAASALWADGGRLDRVLRAARGSGFTVALDPAVPAAALAAQTPTAAASSASPSPSGSSGSASSAAASPGASSSGSPPSASGSAPPSADDRAVRAAKARLAQLTAATRGRGTVALPYADPDVAALAALGTRGPTGAARRDHVLDQAEQAGVEALKAVGLTSGTTLIWPVEDRADAATAALSTGAAPRVLVLPSSAFGAGGELPAHGRMPVTGGDADVLVPDDTLSTAVTATGGSGAAVATQRILAETAATAAGQAAGRTPPGAGSPLLAALPRDWDPDPAAVQSSISALRSAPWLRLAPLSDVRAQPAVAVARTRLLPAPAASRDRLAPARVDAVATQLARVDDFQPALTRGAAGRLLQPIRRTGLELLSTSWARSPAQTGSATDPATPLGRLVARVDGIYDAVQVPDSSGGTLVTWSAQRPMTVRNRLGEKITVVVDLQATGPVRAHSSAPVDVDAFRSRTVLVRLEALTTGDAKISVALRAGSADGPVIARGPTPIPIQVHPKWEGRILTWLGAALALLLVVGLVRGVRRGPRVRIPPESVPDPDDIGREPVVEPGDVTAEAPAAAAPAAPAAKVAQVAEPPRAADPGPLPTADEIFPSVGASTRAAGARGAVAAGGGVAVVARPGTGTRTVDRPGAVHPENPGDGGPGDGDPGEGGTGGSTSGLLSSSAVMAAGTLTSRVLGMLRVAVLAWAIGVGFTADPFAVANTLPNNLFILIGGGVLNAVLVPQIVRAAKHGDGGQEYIDRLVTLVMVVLGGATLLAMALAPVLIRLYEKDWHAEEIGLGTAFALWCLPQIFFYGLYTIYGQILNARGSFGPFMWAPVVNNVVAITGCVVFIALYGGGGKPASWWGASPIAVLAGTATVGVVAQALVLVPALRRVGYRWRPRWGVRGVGLRTAGRVASWTFAGVLLGQLAFVLISRLSTSAAATASAGEATRGRAVYDNAYLLFFLPHSLAAVSLVTAVFTRVAAAASAGRTDDVRSDTSLAVRLTGVATVVSTVAVVVLGRDLARAVFFRNSAAETDSIALVTTAMTLGLVAFSAMYMFQRVYYAYEDARTPFWIQVVVVAVWTSGSVVSAATLPPEWVTPGIGLSMSVSNVAGVVLAGVLLRRRIGGLDGSRLLGTHLRLVAAAVVAGAVAWAVARGVHAVAGTGTGPAYVSLAVAGGALLLVYGIGLRLLRVAELDLVLGPLRRRAGR